MRLRNLMAALMVAAPVALASCASPALVPPADQQVDAGETACIVRGLTGPLLSWVGIGAGPLKALGFKVYTYDWMVAPATLKPCDVIVAHSLGGPAALEAPGPHQVFIIDGFASLLEHCPARDVCVNFFNPGDYLSETLRGARNVDCLTSCGPADAIPFLAHETMPTSSAVWRQIVAAIESKKG